VIDGYICQVVTGHFRDATGAQSPLGMNIFRQDGDRIYYYLENQFHLLYDFGASVNDTLVFSIKKVNYSVSDSVLGFIPVKCVVENVEHRVIDGKEFKAFFTKVILDFEGFPLMWRRYDYMEKIGNLHVFMEVISDEVTAAVYFRELRCYQDEIISNRSDWFQQYGLECDHVGPIVGIANSEDIPRVYPNPANDLLHIEMHGIAAIYIYDMTGRLIFSQNIGADFMPLDTSFLPNGAYILRINHMDGKSSFHKIMKNN
jgi:hypothetical protein